MIQLPPFLPKITPGLYLVATPIGNLGDITLRALSVLHACDVIACEDTRVSSKLLKAYGIHKPLITYHDHNANTMRPEILRRLEAGQIVALISDAGSPLISDPGFKLVQACHGAHLPLTVIPGPSSVIAGLSIAAQPTDRFLFAGFVDKVKLAELASIQSTLVFFEAPPRLVKTLEDMATFFQGRAVSVVRELTKLYEEVKIGTSLELAEYYRAHPPRGEIVIVVGPPTGENIPKAADVTLLLQEALQAHSLKDACTLVAGATGLPRKQIYQQALEMRIKEA